MKRMINRATAGILSLLMLLSLFTGCASSGTIDIEDSGIAYAVWWNPWSGDSGDSSGSGNTSSGNIFGRSWIMSGSNTGTAANADTYADGTAKKDFKALVTAETNKDSVKTVVKSGVTNKPSGETVYANSYGTIDVTHANEGYVTLKLTRSATAKIKGAVDYTDSNGETTYYDWYMDKDKEYSVPMYFGDGSYKVTIFENTTGIKYRSKLSVSVDADLDRIFCIASPSALSIVCIGAVLTHKMFVLDALGRGSGLWVEKFRIQAHFGNFLQHHRVIDRLGGVFPPGERTMATTNDCWDVDGIDAAIAESLHDNVSGVGLIIRLNLLRRQVSSTGD